MKLERRTASLYVQNTGCQQCSPSYGWGPGVRNHFLLHHVIGGKGVYICRDKRYELKSGDTFLIYPDTTIHYCADAQQPWEYVWVGFGGMDAADCVAQTDFSPEEPVFFGRDSGEIRALMESVYRGYGTSPWEEMGMTARLYDLLAFLIRTAQREGDSGREDRDCAQLAADYIITHYEEPITVEGLAAYASRIERACVLLATTNCSIQEISNSVGFEDPFYFSRAFKEVKGLSPRQFANSVRGKS